MKALIVGAGSAGVIAESFFRKRGFDTVIIEREGAKTFLQNHHAIMRLRDRRITEHISCSLEEIEVEKAVFHEGKLYDKPNMLLNNLYSLKVYNEIGKRSLSSLGKVKRFLLDTSKIFSSNVEPRTGTLKEIKNKTAFLEDGSSIGYDICISTIPMPSILSITGIKTVEKFEYLPIIVQTYELNINSTVHQTIYFTEPGLCWPYRVSLERKKMIFESMDDFGEDEWNYCLSAFGLDFSHVDFLFKKDQKYGKIITINEQERRVLMAVLTNKHSIYSLGRYATWRPLRIDHLFDDLEKIWLLVRARTGV
jgi:hypothetical protein